MEHYFHKWTYQIQALHLCVVSALYLIVIHRYVVVTVVSWLADMHAHTRSKVDRYTITSLWLDHWSTIDRPLTDTFCNERYLRILLLLVSHYSELSTGKSNELLPHYLDIEKHGWNVSFKSNEVKRNVFLFQFHLFAGSRFSFFTVK